MNLEVCPAGSDQGQCHGVRGCCGLLPHQQSLRVCSQRRQRRPLYTAAGTDDAEEHPGYQAPARDPVRQGPDQRVHAGTRSQVSYLSN